MTKVTTVEELAGLGAEPRIEMLREVRLGAIALDIGRPRVRTNPFATAADHRPVVATSSEAPLGDDANDDAEALKAWNLEQYGVEDVSDLTNDQLTALRTETKANPAPS